jgi:hypothetical protein
VEIGTARLAVIVWLAYFGLSVAGLGLKILPLSLVANGVSFVVALVAAGLASWTLLILQLPGPLIALVLGSGALAEGAFAILLVTGQAISSFPGA